jgi:hypothetical protein
MIKEIFNFRYYVLFALLLTSVVFIFGERVEEMTFFSWVATLIADKVFGILCGYGFFKLAEFWDKQGKIPFMSIKEEMEDEQI